MIKAMSSSGGLGKALDAFTAQLPMAESLGLDTTGPDASQANMMRSVVGKVSSVWRKGHWKPLLSLPGMNLLPRDQQRKLECQQPSEKDAGNSLEGPGEDSHSERRPVRW